ncbi:cytosolic phospholipase A2 zeta isoform X2 [Brachyhypopomus gauderio]|uniref:cytosolic phospholipase A2 zeta isoform X2 n=1 Tax=Brachyhypopomus gauderio TaxID=698409 RepID=UPI004040FA5F
MKKEVVSHWNLSIKVLKGRFHHSHDILSESDLYVTLHLPTASACTLRTRCVPNSSTPEWNDTFHFRVHSQIKNILEMKVYDKDLIGDDLCITVLFDIASLKLGQKETKVFITNEKTKDELWVEFEITESSEPPGQYQSNGVLVAAPLSTLEVKLDTLLPSADDLVLKLRGAYQEDKVISKSSSILQTLHYYINRDLATEIGLRTSCSHEEGPQHEEDSSQASAPVTPFSSNQELSLSLPVDEQTVELRLKTVESSEEDLKVRLEFDIPPAEKAFLMKRREMVSHALQRVMKLNAPPPPSRVPTVAVVCSGGSSRAMTGMYGSLRGLQRLDLLDTISYITAVSGSTWATASLYTDPCWSRTDMDKAMVSVQKELSKSAAGLFFPHLLRYYSAELEQREQEGHAVSLIDLWGLAIEQLIYGKKYTGTLSDQQRAVSEGQNPLPIYTAVNVKGTGDFMVTEWCEFTPFEVGFPKYGAFVPAENFGSEYFLGHLVKKLPETRISYLLGIWSSVFSANLTELWRSVTGILPSWKPWPGQHGSNMESGHSQTLDTSELGPDVTVLSSFLTGRPVISKVFNFLRGFFLHNNYSNHATFTTWKDKHPDSFPNKLTPVDSVLCLVDSGFAINSSFPPVLREHRRADVILSFNYSRQRDHFKVLRQTQQYCADHSVPFPRINFDRVASEPQREVYVFEDKVNGEVPIVLHFPLVNVSFREYKAPGLKRRGERELREGDVDVSSTTSPYISKNLTYSPEDFQKLANLTTYNVVNNRSAIVQALQRALHRGRQRRRSGEKEL